MKYEWRKDGKLWGQVSKAEGTNVRGAWKTGNMQTSLEYEEARRDGEA